MVAGIDFGEGDYSVAFAAAEPSRPLTLEDLSRMRELVSAPVEVPALRPVRVGSGWWARLLELPGDNTKQAHYFFGMKVYLDESLPPFGWKICWGEE